MLIIKGGSPLPKLPVTSIQQQMARSKMDPDWRPAGFERYAQTSQQMSEMPIVGAAGDVGYDASRFAPVGPLESDNPVK
jgi:hypothetical protein